MNPLSSLLPSQMWQQAPNASTLFTCAELLALKHLQLQLGQAPHKTLGKGGSIQILPFSGQFSKGTRLMPCFLSVSHRRREVWQRIRCIPAGSVTSLPGEQKPRGFPRGKNHKTSAAQVRSPWWAAHHRTCASQAIRRGPAGYTACSPPGRGWCQQYGTCTGQEGRRTTRNIRGPSEAAEEEEGKT